MSGLAVVTGASAGIGRAITLILADAGLEVVAVARRAGELAGFAPTPRVVALAADVTAREGIARVAAAVAGRPLAALVHGAGVFPRGRIAQLTARDWQVALATNFQARLDLVLELRDRLRGGRVLFIGSDAASTPRPGGAAYSVSKAASEMLWRCFSTELGGEMTFGMIKPGLVATAMLEGSLRAPRADFPAGELYAAMQARGETIAPETVARFCRFLLLEASSEELASVIWDIRDASHHPRWLAGPLYAPVAG